ncbi:MAG: FAD-binding oxidoreductase, partial [Jatrophihabitans sp.]
AAVLHAWSTWTAGLPEQATSSLALMRLPALPHVPPPLAGRLTVAVRFAWVGDEAEGRAALAAIEGAGRVVLGGVGPMPYAAIGMIHNDPVDPMPTSEASTLLRELPAEAVEALLAVAGPAAGCPQVIVELRHLGGAIARPQGGPSAFSHRDAAYSLLTIGIAAPPVAAATRAHAAATMAALAPFGDGACLPNFQASADPDAVARKYGAATLARLGELVASYDPDGVLAQADGVRAAAGRAH